MLRARECPPVGVPLMGLELLVGSVWLPPLGESVCVLAQVLLVRCALVHESLLVRVLLMGEHVWALVLRECGGLVLADSLPAYSPRILSEPHAWFDEHIPLLPTRSL